MKMKKFTDWKYYLRIYFSPFIGAYRQMRSELRRADRTLHREGN